jgi:heme/copper-type cytochrome/quinol oxidase subunit 3
MSPHITATLVALKTITLVFGGLITYFAYRAYRRTDAQPLKQLALGFAFVTLGSLAAGGAHQAFGLDLESVLVIEAALTALGFGVIFYSLYAE